MRPETDCKTDKIVTDRGNFRPLQKYVHFLVEYLKTHSSKLYVYFVSDEK